jgi:cell division protein FtsX
MRKHRFRNSYMTAGVSVSLVLCLIGIECVLLLSAGALLTRMRENVTITAVLSQEADSTQCARLERMLVASEGYSSFRYVSKEEALQENIVSLGEDPTSFDQVLEIMPSSELVIIDGADHFFEGEYGEMMVDDACAKIALW